MPSTGPSGFGRNEYYPTHEEYLHAVAEAMREEYLAIVAAGFILQVDDPFLIDMLSDPTMEQEERERLGVDPRRGAEPRAPRHPRRERSATTRATASTTARA